MMIQKNPTSAMPLMPTSRPPISNDNFTYPPEANSAHLFARSALGPGSPLGMRGISTHMVRVMKPPRAGVRSKPGKAEKSADSDITGPLSEITMHMVYILIKDMEAWVNQPIEVRHQEVAQKNGKIARPMNSFMLYRSAYAERTKEWCAHNSHQVVSRATGKSWSIEPPNVRQRFEALAKTKSVNHQKAHPEYKFSPSKTQTLPRKKWLAGDDDNSDTEDAGFGSVRQIKQARSTESDSCYASQESTPFDSQDSILSESFNQASWQLHNPDRARPTCTVMSQSDHTYYFSPHREHLGSEYNASATLAGIPGSIYLDLLRPYPGGTSDLQVLVDNPTTDIWAFNHCHYALWQYEHDDLNNFMPITNPMISNAMGFDGLPNSHGI